MRKFAIGIAGVLLSAGVAQAASVNYVATTSISNNPVANAGMIALPGFQAGVGGVPLDAILTGVTVSFTGSWTANFVAFADTTDSANISAAADFVQLSLFAAPGSGQATPFFSPVSASGTAFTNLTVAKPGFVSDNNFSRVPPVTYDCDGIGEPVCDSYAQMVGDTLSSGPLAGSSLAAYDTAGSIIWNTFGFATVNGNFQTEDGVFSGVQNTRYSLTADVTYSYRQPPTESVPVPAALPLLAGAVGVFGLVRSRRRT